MSKGKLFVGMLAAVFAAQAVLADEYFGLEHQPLGQAQLSPTKDGGLLVSNLGITGGDGVIIAPLSPYTTLWGPDFIDLGAPEDKPEGSVVSLTSRGMINGEPDQVASECWSQYFGTEVLLYADFSGVQASGMIASYYYQNKLLVIEVIDGPQFACTTSWEKNKITIDMHLFPPDLSQTIEYCKETSCQTMFGEFLPNVDSIHLETIGLGVQFGGYSSASMTSDAVTSFIITEEVYEFEECPSEGCSGNERLKAKAKDRNGCQVKGIVTGGTPGSVYGISMPGACILRPANSNGKAVAKFKDLPSGEHVVEVPTCGLSRTVSCP